MAHDHLWGGRPAYQAGWRGIGSTVSIVSAWIVPSAAPQGAGAHCSQGTWSTSQLSSTRHCHTRRGQAIMSRLMAVHQCISAVTHSCSRASTSHSMAGSSHRSSCVSGCLSSPSLASGPSLLPPTLLSGGSWRAEPLGPDDAASGKRDTMSGRGKASDASCHSVRALGQFSRGPLADGVRRQARSGLPVDSFWLAAGAWVVKLQGVYWGAQTANYANFNAMPRTGGSGRPKAAACTQAWCDAHFTPGPHI